METLDILTIIYIIGIIISIAFAVRFWITMTRIKQIRDHLLYRKPTEPEQVYEVERDYIDPKEITALIAKLKPDQCVVFVNKTLKLEIWNKSDWEDVVRLGKSEFFKLLHKNF
ncbi:MAG: hypothetical protein VB102_14305 [Paludibacter sp.]|nr:hypothetical protein [Paludibacter sp.]